jgi:hypothetical protein
MPWDTILEPYRTKVEPCAPASYAPIETPKAPMVLLRTVGGRGVIERRNNAYGWGDVCLEPCYKQLDPQFLYRVSTNSGGQASDAFALPREGKLTRVDARFRPRTMNMLGGILSVGAVHLLVIGAASYGVGNIIDRHGSTGEWFRDSGKIEMILAATFAVIGIPIYLLSQPTTSVSARSTTAKSFFSPQISPTGIVF